MRVRAWLILGDAMLLGRTMTTHGFHSMIPDAMLYVPGSIIDWGSPSGTIKLVCVEVPLA